MLGSRVILALSQPPLIHVGGVGSTRFSEAQCHFCHVLLAKASHEVSQAQREGNKCHLWMEIAAKPHRKGREDRKQAEIRTIFVIMAYVVLGAQQGLSKQ